MQIQDIKPIHKRKSRKRVGRGGKRGTYSGKGVKGQNSRAGRKFRPAIRDLIKRYPKLRGTRFRQGLGGQVKSKLTILNLDVLEKHFNVGEVINPQVLLEKKLIRKIKGWIPQVKILGDGKLTKAINLEHCLFSKQAKEKIEKSNGVVK